MHLPEDAVLLRIFIGERDRYQHRPLYEAIVLKARELNLAGATVLRGPMGFGKSSHLHTAKILRLSMDLPIVIEIVDSEDKVNAFLPVLDQMMGGGLVTLETAKVIRYRDQQKSVPVVTVEGFYNSHAEKLHMKLEGSRVGFHRKIREPTINRPGLALSGFYTYFAEKRVQVLGAAEHSYLKSLPSNVRVKRF